MKAFSFTVKSKSRSQLIDITSSVRQGIQDAGITDAVCVIYVPHTTAGITINECADPDVSADIIACLDRMVPWRADYRHREGNAAAHIKASLMGSSVNVAVSAGRLMLGTWQGIFFCEFDGPRTRNVNVYAMTGKGLPNA